MLSYNAENPKAVLLLNWFPPRPTVSPFIVASLLVVIIPLTSKLLVTRALPLTSNVLVGFSVPIPTLPPIFPLYIFIYPFVVLPPSHPLPPFDILSFTQSSVANSVPLVSLVVIPYTELLNVVVLPIVAPDVIFNLPSIFTSPFISSAYKL